MYLKIEVDGEEQFYSFENKKIVTIGRAPECDVQLLVEGVSRDHLLIMETETGDFKFIDLGSTNGTYLNGQPIEKDVETDFNSFFPIKLGSQVYVYLIDEVSANAVQEEIAQKDEEKKKRALDFPLEPQIGEPQIGEPQAKELTEEDLKNKKRQALQDRIYVPKAKPPVTDHDTTRVIKRPTIAVGSSNEKKKGKNSPNKFTMLLGLLAGIGLAYYFSPKEEKPITPTTSAPVKAPIEPKKKIERPLGERMMGIAGLDKCLGEVESSLCSELKKVRPLLHKEGFLKFGPRLYLVIRLDGVFEGYKNYKLSSMEQAKLLKAMALNLGRRFSEAKVKKNDLVLQRPDIKSELSKRSALFIDLALSKAFKSIKNLEEINEVTVVLVNNEGFIQRAVLGPKQLLELESEKLATDLLYYWRSGLERPLARYLDGEKGKVLTTTIEKK